MKKTALITGSSKGIGKELSLLLMEKGYTIFGYSRTNSIRHKNFHFNQIDLSSIQNLESINIPEYCPSCSNVLKTEGPFLRCDNGMKCPAQLFGFFEHFGNV